MLSGWIFVLQRQNSEQLLRIPSVQFQYRTLQLTLRSCTSSATNERPVRDDDSSRRLPNRQMERRSSLLKLSSSRTPAEHREEQAGDKQRVGKKIRQRDAIVSLQVAACSVAPMRFFNVKYM
jgi:hypothetical protein